MQKSKYGKWKQAKCVRRAWKSAEVGRSQIGSVRQVERVSGKARTPWKRRLSSEETRHSAEDEAWVHEVAEGHPGYLKSIRWYSVCLQLSQTGVDLNQAIRVLGLSVAKSDWVWDTTWRGTGAQGCAECTGKCSMSCFSSLSENGTKTQGGAEWVGRVLEKARTSAEEEARLGRGQASCGR